MVLESQMGRAGSGRQYMSTRRRRGLNLKAPLALLVVAGVVGLAYYMIRHSGGAAEANGSETLAPTGVGSPAHEVQTPAGEPAPPPPSGALGRADPAMTSRQTTPPPRQTSAPPAPANPTPARGADAAPTVAANDRPAPQSPATSPDVAQRIVRGRQLIQQNQLVAGRAELNTALKGTISPADAEAVRHEIAAINEKLIFSPLVDKADPFTSDHVLQPGEYLSTIAPAYHVPWQFIQRINRISDVRRIRANQRLKVVKGPFHVVVDKSAFRADVYLTAGTERMYVRSFKVGLGEFDSTPVGKFVVRKHSKLEDPEWVNPRTGQRFHSSDPKNPIGEHWIGLRGVDANTEQMYGYGLHGTIEPQSIGKQASMGCVRFLPEDIALLFSMLTEEQSTVTILP